MLCISASEAFLRANMAALRRTGLFLIKVVGDSSMVKFVVVMHSTQGAGGDADMGDRLAPRSV